MNDYLQCNSEFLDIYENDYLYNQEYEEIVANGEENINYMNNVVIN